MPGLVYKNTGGTDGGLLYGADGKLMEGCCCGTTEYRQVRKCSDDTFAGLYVPVFAVADTVHLRTSTGVCYYELMTDPTTTSPGTILDYDVGLEGYWPDCDSYPCLTCTGCSTSGGNTIPAAFDVTISGWNACTGACVNVSSGTASAEASISGTINGTFRIVRGDPSVSGCWWEGTFGDLLGTSWFTASSTACDTVIVGEGYVYISAFSGVSGSGYFVLLVDYYWRVDFGSGFGAWQVNNIFQTTISGLSSPPVCRTTRSGSNIRTLPGECTAFNFGGDGSMSAVPV